MNSEVMNPEDVIPVVDLDSWGMNFEGDMNSEVTRDRFHPP